MTRSLPTSTFLALVTAASISHAASGGAPLSVTQSGYVLDSADLPLNAVVSLRFRIFDAATDGTLEWDATCSGVSVAEGYYSVVLGGTACVGSSAGGLDPTLDTSDLPAGATRWLEVEAEGFVLTPRLSLHTVPTAAVASRALSADLLGVHPASDFALLVHSHAVAEVDGLQAALDDKAALDHGHALADVSGLQGALDAKAPVNHTHTLAQVTGLQGALDSKAAVSHSHAIAEVTGLQAALDAPKAVASGALPATVGPAGTEWFSTDKKLYVSDGTSWIQIGSGTPIQGGAPGTDCVTLKAQGQPSGTYTLDPNGGANTDQFTGYCEMATDGGGWMQLMNLRSNDGVQHGFNDTTFWLGTGTEGSAANSFSAGFKSAAVTNTGGFNQVMIWMHNAGTPLGYAIYDVLPQHQTSNWYQLIGGNTNLVLTGVRTKQSGNSGASTNCCSEDRTGDPFIDAQNGDPLVLNQQTSSLGFWGSDAITNVRLGTMAGSGNWTYPHTLGGLGGHHERPVGQYVTDYESAPILAYCNPTFAYGNTTNISGGAIGQGSPACAIAPTYLPRDFAVFVRKQVVTSPPLGSQGNPGLSCKDLQTRGIAQSGPYWIQPGGTGTVIQAYCNMLDATGGWTLLVNLSSATRTQHYFSDTNFWLGSGTEGSATRPFAQSYKGEAFSRLPFKEVMVQVHNAGSVIGYGLYDVQAAYQALPLQALFTTYTNLTFTAARRAQFGSSGTSTNCCTENRYGDPFIDSQNGEALVLNQQWNGGTGAPWGTDTITLVRLATTAGLGNTSYPHTMAGLGGHHERPPNQYVTNFQSSPIMAYCNPTYAYGSNGGNITGGAVGQGSTGVCAVQPTYLPRDHAIYVR